RMRVLSPELLLERLEHRLPLLVGSQRDLPARQQTLTATISWSYDLLDQGEQRLFRRLSAFVGGFTLEAAEAVCGDADMGLASWMVSNPCLQRASSVAATEIEVRRGSTCWKQSVNTR